MELVLISEKHREKQDSTLHRREYTIAGYKVVVDDFCYDGDFSRHIATYKMDVTSYLPCIEYDPEPIGKKEPCFKVWTVSYGNLDMDAFKKFIKDQQIALKVAEVLTREFCK